MLWLRRGIGILLIGLGLLCFSYVPSAIYLFAPPRPFHGSGWYNPFSGDTLLWSKANFHIHTRTWGGLTNGKQSPSEIRRVYDSLSYRWIGLSDYQRINPQSPIPLYEHGWNIQKVHQLCFWPARVVWDDFFLWQPLSVKQFVLEKLRPTTPFLVLAHPRFLRSYGGKELAQLGGYDAIEVLNRYGDSVEEWDSALSSGHYAPILAHDNVHDVYNPHEVMSRWTEIASVSLTSSESLYSTLKAGRTVGYKNRTPSPLAQYPTFRKIHMRGDTLQVRISEKVDSIRVVGQNGKVAATSYGTDSLLYIAKKQDTYLRIEAYTEKVEAYTSPLVRGEPVRRQLPPREGTLTWLWRVSWFFGGGGGLIGGYFLLKRRSAKAARRS
ncbi:MAG: hypothetical protein N2170_08450 [Bacteroidia bacterium]|nr:hypothetical protein [Bacteroidia bacterium]